MRTRTSQQSLSARKPYPKASMHIVEIEASDVLTTSGGQQPPAPQVESFKKQSTSDWF
ncbi:MAG: hypothetical protein HUK21_12865 [Fibrobacteraceae bacterium]|nr:hypothetical protein [Fibrobacteraceae bacterium]